MEIFKFRAIVFSCLLSSNLGLLVGYILTSRVAFIDELETEIDSFDFLNGELRTLLAL